MDTWDDSLSMTYVYPFSDEKREDEPKVPLYALFIEFPLIVLYSSVLQKPISWNTISRMELKGACSRKCQRPRVFRKRRLF